MKTLFLLALTLSATGLVQAQEKDLFNLPFTELNSVEVTSVSKRQERASSAAAAVFVITQEDIRRSGATRIPQLLRMVPGVQVAEYNQQIVEAEAQMKLAASKVNESSVTLITDKARLKKGEFAASSGLLKVIMRQI